MIYGNVKPRHPIIKGDAVAFKVSGVSFKGRKVS